MSKNGHGREILIIFGRGSGLSEDEAVAVETEHITTTIDVLPETRGPRLRGAVRHRTGMTTVDRHAVILLTPTYLVIEVNDDTKAGAGHHHRDDRPVGLCPARRHLQDDVNMMTRDQEDTVTVPAGLQHRYAEAAEGLESVDTPLVAVIEQDPTHPQIRLAHGHPEDYPEGGGALTSYPPVPTLHEDYGTASTGEVHYHHHRSPDPVLVR